MATFFITVPTKNRPDDLERLLERLVPQLCQRPNVKLMVVNDGSHDDEYQRVVDRFSDDFEYKSLERSVGPGPARHSAFKDATADYFICTDDDCLPPENWLFWMEATALAYPETDLFAGVAAPASHKPLSLYQKMLCVPRLFPKPLFTQGNLLTAVGANCMFKREAYVASGGYSPDMNGAVEDCYLTQKMLDAGANYAVLQGATTYHQSATNLRALWRRFSWYGKNGAKYALEEQNWRVAGLSHASDRQERWANIKRKTLNEWTAAYHSDRLSLQRITHTAVVAFTALAYERSWKKAAFAAGEKPMPSQPKIFDRFVDFTDETRS